MVRFQFVGCGDAFGSGGRFNTCFHLTAPGVNMLVDCGASSLISMKRLGIDRNRIETILITHFHADHFGGIPFFLLDAQFYSKRTEPLTIAGPPGISDWFERVMETAFPGSSTAKRRFDVKLIPLPAGEPRQTGKCLVTPIAVNHGNEGGPYFAYRIKAAGKTIAYSGDTEWTDGLVAAAENADLFVAEALFFDRKIPLHLDLATLAANRARLGARRIVLTHMSDDMLGRLDTLPFEAAADGLVLDV